MKREGGERTGADQEGIARKQITIIRCGRRFSPLLHTMNSDTTTSDTLMNKNDHDNNDGAIAMSKSKQKDGIANSGESDLSLPPSYRSIKQTPLYVKAKEELRDGSLESALVTIESCLTETLSQLSGDEFNVALAPLYYLYGTTLLYSVEENDALISPPPQDHLFTEQQQQQQLEENEEEKEEENSENQLQQQHQEMAEDIQVAWENLDLARTILHRVLDDILPTLFAETTSSSSNGHASTTTLQNSIKVGKSDGLQDADDCIAEQIFDLGQIYLRLGDIQKGNGNYLNAVEDYDMCKNIWVGLRKLCQKAENERKVAHCYYCIGEVYMMMANEADATQVPSEGEAYATAATASIAAAAATTTTTTQAEIDQYRKMSILNYLTCGQTFANVILQLCDQDMFIVDNNNTSIHEKVVSSSLADIVQDSSEKLKCLRTLVAPKTPSCADFSPTVAEIKEILDEIQEVIDSSISEAQVLRENMAQMKKSSTASVEEDGNPNDLSSDKDGLSSTTTIGFGPSILSTSSANATIPILVAKKKKKVTGEEADGIAGPKKQKIT